MRVIFYLFYDLIFLAVFAIYLPVYFLRRKVKFFSLRQRLGFWGKVKLDDCVVIHAVSVGEVILAGKLIDAIKEKYGLRVVVSVTTLTGYTTALRRYAHTAKIVFAPLDLSWIVRRFVRRFNPKIFIALETEIWPNIFRELKKRNIPAVILNGRISDRAYLRYRFIRPVTCEVFKNCDFIGAQNEEYKKRFIALGCPPEKVSVAGNMKLDTVVYDPKRLEELSAGFLPLLKGVDGQKILFLAASTHDPEEKITIDAYAEILNAHPNVTLLIAPRHVERVKAIEKMIATYGFTPCRLKGPQSQLSSSAKVYIIDSVGELVYFYALCDFCFVGGSMVNHGGHNILEPVYFSKPVCFGPHMQNFMDIERIVLEKEAAIKAEDAADLKRILIQMATSPTLRQRLSSNCRNVFSHDKSSLDKCLDIVAAHIKL